MKAKSIKGKSPEQIRSALQQSMADARLPMNYRTAIKGLTSNQYKKRTASNSAERYTNNACRQGHSGWDFKPL